MSSTKNTKDNRQVVRATFHTPESIFKIPDGLDLEDKSVVEDWGVKWNKLYITYVNGEEIEIEPTWDAADTDWKRPAECEIMPAEDTGYCYSEDESDDEEELRKKLKEIDPGLKDSVISKWDMKTLEKEYTKRLKKKEEKEEKTPWNCEVCEKPLYDMLIAYKEGTFCKCKK